MFISLANFYQRFIQGYSRIAVLFIFLLKTIRLFEKLTSKAFKVDDNRVVDGSDNSTTNETVVNLLKNKKSRKLTYVPNIGAMGEPNFLTPNAKKVFNHLWLVFIKASILQHFNLENHI